MQPDREIRPGQIRWWRALDGERLAIRVLRRHRGYDGLYLVKPIADGMADRTAFSAAEYDLRERLSP